MLFDEPEMITKVLDVMPAGVKAHHSRLHRPVGAYLGADLAANRHRGRKGSREMTREWNHDAKPSFRSCLMPGSTGPPTRAQVKYKQCNQIGDRAHRSSIDSSLTS